MKHAVLCSLVLSAIVATPVRASYGGPPDGPSISHSSYEAPPPAVVETPSEAPKVATSESAESPVSVDTAQSAAPATNNDDLFNLSDSPAASLAPAAPVESQSLPTEESSGASTSSPTSSASPYVTVY